MGRFAQPLKVLQNRRAVTGKRSHRNQRHPLHPRPYHTPTEIVSLKPPHLRPGHQRPVSGFCCDGVTGPEVPALRGRHLHSPDSNLQHKSEQTPHLGHLGSETSRQKAAHSEPLRWIETRQQPKRRNCAYARPGVSQVRQTGLPHASQSRLTDFPLRRRGQGARSSLRP